MLDKTTLKDLHVLGNPGHDLFSLIDCCVTQKGREALKAHFLSPPPHLASLLAFQKGIQFFVESDQFFPKQITNGTLVMIEQFYQSGDWVSRGRSPLEIRLTSWFRKWFSPQKEDPQFFYLSHFRDLVLGADQVLSLVENEGLPPILEGVMEEIRSSLDHEIMDSLRGLEAKTRLQQISTLSFQLRRGLKSRFESLIQNMGKLDAWISMARSTRELGWVFPQFSKGEEDGWSVEGLYHPLIQGAITYDFPYLEENRFLFLTGANMSGKTTLMRSLGVAVFLAHSGMGVPARSMNTVFLDFVITNMSVEDDLLKGESYFFAEVQRIKWVAQYLNQGKRGLVLLDEMFKGTNVHDAHACTAAMVEGLLNHGRHWIVLSSHLFEVAKDLESDPRIRFAYMATDILPDGDYRFQYELRDGISRDQIGYQILVREGVLDCLAGRSSSSGC